MADKYDHLKIEKKWQKTWEKNKDYEAKVGKGKKFYPLVEFPYPSGEGIHMGHPRSFVAMDIIARKRRAEGFNVIYPIGWDAFGLPAENYAIKTGVHPKITTKKNTDNFRRQLKSLGISFDWSREIDTSDPNYYKWTQWIFLQFFKKELAYKAEMPINWCLSCKIGLANEEVIDGKCERCGGETEKRNKNQWMLAITKYAERLHKDLDDVDYLPQVVTQQRNWIGKSEGAEINFKIYPTDFKNHKEQELEKLTVFTTRPDTLFGATYLVISPEHSLLKEQRHKIKNFVEIGAYVVATSKKSEMDRMADNKEKTGVKIEGLVAINPGNKEEIPIYVADYVLMGYGTGAIMAVPAHDERDFEFAKKFNLPIREVIEPAYSQSTEPGKVREGLPIEDREAIIAIVKHHLEDKFLALKWKKVAWGTFVTGGIENGQTAEEAARLEIKEETGYKNLKFIKNFGTLHGKFFHVPKGVNRFAHSQTLYFQLENDERDEVNPKEKEIHEPLWLTVKELREFLTPDTHKYALGILEGKNTVYTGPGLLVNSGNFDRSENEAAKKEIIKFVGGKEKISFKLRDWVFSRQRYWGEPIPIIHCEKCGMVAVPEKDLPLKLPEVENYKPTNTGESPLVNITSWVNVKCPKCKGAAKRETDVMPNWAGSSWYYLRYCDPDNKKEFASKKALKYFTPVDWYNGGMEHTTLHLLYSRFWHKFLYDLKLVPTKEPYQKRTSQGLILASDGTKMSKSKGNVINPDSIVEKVGADTLRLYEMFMGPFDQAIMWNEDALVGCRRFIERVWRLQEKIKNERQIPEIETVVHKTIKKVSEDIEGMKFNTAVSALMQLSNSLDEFEAISENSYKILVRLLAPFTPHIAEEIWSNLGEKKSIHTAPWPKFDAKKIIDSKVSVAISINGKMRALIELSGEEGEGEATAKAKENKEITKWLSGKNIRKVIYIKGKIINFVTD